MAVHFSKAQLNLPCLPARAQEGESDDSKYERQRGSQGAAESPTTADDRSFGKVERRAIASLKKNARNARTHDDKQIAQIAGSIRKFGFTNPVLIDDQGLVLAGHGRLAAAERLGWLEVPTLTLAGLTEAQKRAYTETR